MAQFKEKAKQKVNFIFNVAFFAMFVYAFSLLPGMLKQFTNVMPSSHTVHADSPTIDATDATDGRDATDGACDGVGADASCDAY